MMRFKLALIGLSLTLGQATHAQVPMEKILKVRNDKEVLVATIKKGERKKIKEKFNNPKINEKITNLFYESLQNFLSREDKQCELRLIEVIKKNFEAAKIDSSEEGLQDIFKMLRVTNAIDDILYDILSGVNRDFSELGVLKLTGKPLRISFKRKKLIKNNNLEELFAGFKEWPDESSRCSYQEFVFIKNNVRNKDNRLSKKKSELKHLVYRAYKENVIDLATFRKLEYLRSESFLKDRNYWLQDYLKVIFNAKNKMRPIKATYVVRNLEEEDDFSSERIRRFTRMTRRQLLYKKYDETQIILLAQVLQKSSKRMGTDPDTISSVPFITQEFQTLNESGERDTYVEKIELDTQSQYNLARRLLRKDMTELQMMDIFIGIRITFEDIVVAAYETGYITVEDIEYVVKYDDLWNPTTSNFEKVVGFVGTVARMGSIFVPIPWNIPTSIALGIAEGLILNTRKNGAENDNPATFIE